MGYHHNPIEPSEWSHGPDEPTGEECHECEGTGEVVGPNDEDRTCPECGGSGYKEIEPPLFGDEAI